MKIQTGVQRLKDEYKTFNIKKENCAKFQTHAVWNQDLNLVQELPAEQQIHNFYATVKTADEDFTPKAIIRKFHLKRWWSEELTEARDRGERFYRIYQKNIMNET